MADPDELGGESGRELPTGLEAPDPSFVADAPFRDCAHAPTGGIVLSPFGMRRSVQDRRRTRQHNGVDIVGAVGDPVWAAADGIVEHATENGVRGFGCYGRVVVIAHPQWGEDRTMYAHLSRVDVVPGQRVLAGDLIGAVGATNGSEANPGTTFREGACSPGGVFDRTRRGISGPHLHFETAPASYPMRYEAPRHDPLEWLADRGVVYEPRGARGRARALASCPAGELELAEGEPLEEVPDAPIAQRDPDASRDRPKRNGGAGPMVLFALFGVVVGGLASRGGRR